MSLQQPPEEIKQGAPDWMVTFADLMSLLLTFFVLLLSFSSMEVAKFNTLSGAIRSAFGLKSPLDLSNKPSGSKLLQHKAPSENSTSSDTKNRLMIVKLRGALEQAGLSEQGSVQVVEEGVSLRLDGDVLFASGRADLQAAGSKILDHLIEIAGTSAGEIRVEGHTDDVPISTSRFPSNWELSAARAGSAVRYLNRGGVPANRLRAIGFADTRPVVPNTNPENRGKNRRIEFLFVRPAGERPGAGDGDRIHFTAPLVAE